jgi:hypothetical protein
MKHVYDLLALTDVVREACTATIRLENCRDLALTGMQTDESGARPNAVEALQRILAESAGRRFDESQAATDRGVDPKEALLGEALKLLTEFDRPDRDMYSWQARRLHVLTNQVLRVEAAE